MGSRYDDAANSYLRGYRERWGQRSSRNVPRTVAVGGLRVQVRPRVFDPDPGITWSTSSIVEQLPDDLSGTRVLDIGTGSGILALLAFKRGAEHVVAVDNFSWAVRNARMNADNIEGTRARVQILQGDLFEFPGASSYSVGGEPFDVILANLPIAVGHDDTRCAQVEAIDEAPRYLALGGKMLLTYASFGTQWHSVLDAMKRSSLRWRVDHRDHLGVSWTVCQGTRSAVVRRVQ